MRRITLIFALFICTSVAASAQTSSSAPGQSSKKADHGYFYVFGAPGGTIDRFHNIDGGTLHLGGGGEAVFNNGVGIGAELGYLAPFKYFGDGLGTFSVNGSYNFLNASKSGKVVPFVTGGYTGFFRDGFANGINFGGGVNYWLNRRVGLRFEFRNNVYAEEDGIQFVNFRVGLTFR